VAGVAGGLPEDLQAVVQGPELPIAVLDDDVAWVSGAAQIAEEEAIAENTFEFHFSFGLGSGRLEFGLAGLAVGDDNLEIPAKDDLVFPVAVEVVDLKPDVIIDHHPDTGVKAPFLDIRPNYGATATIMTEYLWAARIKPSAKLATALFHAIKTDTHDFTAQTQMEDVKAFQYLFRHANIHLARKIEQADLRLDYLKYFKTALQAMRLRKGWVFAHLGPVENPDICVIMADFFMRVSSVKWSIVSGTCDKKLVIIFRNDGIRKNAGRVAKDSFGQLGSAGGHKTMARAELSLSGLKEQIDYRDAAKLQLWIINRTKKKS